ncbi:MAG: cation:proton antiporter, partial [Actinomycetota bacterium]|nr:cation:proton antiporter [Actinomycetota bacterium]
PAPARAARTLRAVSALEPPLLAAAEGFSAGDPYALGVLFAGIALFVAVSALSHQQDWAFTAAIVYLLLGAMMSLGFSLLGVDLLDPFSDAIVIERVTEVAVIIALFSAGLKIDRKLRWRDWRSAMLLLVFVMPVTIAAVAALGVVLMGLSLGAAIVLGAALAPTDPVLASDVQVGPPGDADEPEPRFALTAEAGFNDGLAFPFVLLGVFVAGRGGTGWIPEWVLADVVYALAVGVVIGVLAGRAIAGLVSRLHAREWLSPALDGWLAIATVLLVYGATEAVGAYGFLAAFAGGLAFRRFEDRHEFHRRVHDGATTVEQFAELAVLLLLGSTITLAGLGTIGVGGWLLAVLLLLAVRPLVTLAAFAGSRLSLGERGFVAWFGIRGIGSFYYVAVALGTGVLVGDEAELVYWTVIACVGLSIVLHGISSTPAARRIGL